MENKKFNIDDPQNVNSFLALIGGSQVSSTSERSRTAAATSVNPGTLSDNQAYQDRDKLSSRSSSVNTSPARATAASPTTSGAGVVLPDTVVSSDEPAEEDGSDILRTLAEASNLNLSDSKYASKNYAGRRTVSTNTKYATMPTRCPPVMSFSNSFAPLNEDVGDESPSKMKEHGKQVSRYQDEVIAKFLENNLPEDSHRGTTGVSTLGDNLLAADQKPEPQTESFAVADTDVDPIIQASTDKVTQSTVETPQGVKITSTNPTMIVTVAPDNGKDWDVGTEEDREHLTHFKSWGTPEPRNRPNARPRKIMLHNLPADSDLTLAQSLIYGGAIETFSLSPTKTSAYVTFVTADACDAFFNAHPNGIVFKNPKTRRSHAVYVDRGLEVDVVSSVLQAYLDCEASRVVRASGAEEDWGMGALYKLAEAKNRKVETIIDTYRDKVRTIIFRFTNIADAVAFRGQLLRDDEWEMCNIQFMIDPAEKATGIHLED